MNQSVATGSGGYYGNVNPTLLDVVDASARRICEFGCGAGAFARAVRQRCGQVHYVGVELIAQQLEQARDALNVALLRDLDQVPDWTCDEEMNSALPMGTFDHVIFGDVLEHLRDPERALAQAVRRLAVGGSALICLPNVQHWTTFANLALGTWPRQDAGLFDRTHLRWFTLDDAVNLMRGAGLVVEKVVPRIFGAEQGAEVLPHLAPWARAMGVDFDQFRLRSLALQYVLVGRAVAA